MTRALLLLFACALLACAPSARWGDRLVWSPDVHGYAFERSSGAWPLVDRVSGKKLLCAEDVTAMLPHEALARATFASDDAKAFAWSWPIATATLPVGGPGVMLMIGGGFAELPAEGIAWAASSPSATSLYERGRSALAAEQTREAEELFARSLVRDAIRGEPRCERCESIRALRWLGRTYEMEGRTSDAARAYADYLERATIRDREGYDDAEARLAKLAPSAVHACASREPVTIAWPPSR